MNGPLRSTIDPPPLRSLLFTPANHESRMRKALTTGADGVVFDLESAIPRSGSETARAMVRRALDAGLEDDIEGDIGGDVERRPARFVRVSDVGSRDFVPDLESSMHASLTGILLPQVERPADVAAAAGALDELDPDGRVIIVPLVETASAVRLAFEIATTSPRIAYFGAGVSRNGDIARSIGYRWTEGGDETLFLRSKVLVDSRAAGIANPITGIWGNVADLDGLRRFAIRSRDLGYDGLMCIHPSHIPVIHEVFTPSTDELREAAEVVEAMRAAEESGVGAVQLGGRLVDAAHVKTAGALLDRARRLGVPSPEY